MTNKWQDSIKMSIKYKLIYFSSCNARFKMSESQSIAAVILHYDPTPNDIQNREKAYLLI
jgi:hypothetical protein